MAMSHQLFYFEWSHIYYFTIYIRYTYLHTYILFYEFSYIIYVREFVTEIMIKILFALDRYLELLIYIYFLIVKQSILSSVCGKECLSCKKKLKLDWAYHVSHTPDKNYHYARHCVKPRSRWRDDLIKIKSPLYPWTCPAVGWLI